MQKYLTYIPAFVTISLFLITWEIYAAIGPTPHSILPPPSAILNAIIRYQTPLFMHTTQTLLETLLGLGSAIILGLTIAYVIYASQTLRRAVYPILVISQTIPMIALAPLLLIWFGFGILPKVIIVTLYCFFPIAVATADGLMRVDREIIDLMKSYRASKWQIFTLVRLPGALPSFFSGLKISVTYAITGAIVGEYVGASRGLGIYMQQAAKSYVVVQVFAAIFIVIALSMILLGAVFILERMAIPWKNNKH